MPEEKIFYQAYKHGKYYNPASSHYDGLVRAFQPYAIMKWKCLTERIMHLLFK